MGRCMQIGRVTRDKVFSYGPPTVARRPSTVIRRPSTVIRGNKESQTVLDTADVVNYNEPQVHGRPAMLSDTRQQNRRR